MFTANKILLIILFTSLHTFGEDKEPSTHILNFQVLLPLDAREEVIVEIHTKPFDFSKHKIESSKSVCGVTIDGEIAYGCDGVESIKKDVSESICEIIVNWKGKKIIMKPELFNTVFNYELTKKTDDLKSLRSGFAAVLTSDRTTLMINMSSNRSATFCYTAYWIISENGDQSRFIEQYLD